MKPWILSIGLALSLQTAPTGNGSISGVVRESSTSSPIPDVEVEISAVRLDGASSPTFNIHATTDESGRFAVRGLPSGRYRLHWQREGFFTTESALDDGFGIGISTGRPPLNVWKYGTESGRNAANLAMEVLVDAAQPGKELTLSLVAGGVISGRILDLNGQPLAGGKVAALAMAYEQGYPYLYEVDSVSADERGNFRFWGMAPGNYYIRAEYRNSQEQFHYTYFPGALTAADAQAMTVASGAEYKGANFNIQPGASKIKGTVVITPASLAGPRRLSGDGTPLPYYVRHFLIPLEPNNTVDIQTLPQAYGDRFEFRGVRPGNYVLYAMLSPERREGADERNEPLAGRTTIRVGTQDLENVSIAIAPPNEVRGRIVAVDGARLPNEKLAIHWRLRAGIFPRAESLQSWTHPDPDGTFRFPGIAGVRYGLAISDLPSDTAVVDIRQRGTSVFDEGISADGDSAPIEVVISGAAGKITANVVDAKGKTVPEAIVALVPAKEHQMNPNLYRRGKFDAASGRYLIEGIAPGDYTLFAWDSILDDAEYNAAFLKEFEERGIRVTVRPRETTSLSLPLTPGERR